jgi:hypothetical protein
VLARFDVAANSRLDDRVQTRRPAARQVRPPSGDA